MKNTKKFTSLTGAALATVLLSTGTTLMVNSNKVAAASSAIINKKDAKSKLPELKYSDATSFEDILAESIPEKDPYGNPNYKLPEEPTDIQIIKVSTAKEFVTAITETHEGPYKIELEQDIKLPYYISHEECFDDDYANNDTFWDDYKYNTDLVSDQDLIIDGNNHTLQDENFDLDPGRNNHTLLFKNVSLVKKYNSASQNSLSHATHTYFDNVNLKGNLEFYSEYSTIAGSFTGDFSSPSNSNAIFSGQIVVSDNSSVKVDLTDTTSESYRLLDDYLYIGKNANYEIKYNGGITYGPGPSNGLYVDQGATVKLLDVAKTSEYYSDSDQNSSGLYKVPEISFNNPKLFEISSPNSPVPLFNHNSNTHSFSGQNLAFATDDFNFLGTFNSSHLINTDLNIFDSNEDHSTGVDLSNLNIPNDENILVQGKSNLEFKRLANKDDLVKGINPKNYLAFGTDIANVLRKTDAGYINAAANIISVPKETPVLNLNTLEKNINLSSSDPMVFNKVKASKIELVPNKLLLSDGTETTGGVIKAADGSLDLAAKKVDNSLGNALVKVTYDDGTFDLVPLTISFTSKASQLTPATSSQKPGSVLKPAVPNDNAKVIAHTKEISVDKSDTTLPIAKASEAITLTDKYNNPSNLKPTKVEYIPNKVQLKDKSLADGGVITDQQGTLNLSAAKVDNALGNALVKLTFADGSTLNVAITIVPTAKASSLTPATATQKPSSSLTPAKPHDNAKVNAHIKDIKVIKDTKLLDIDKVNKALVLTDKNNESTDIKPSKIEFVPNKVMLNDHSLVDGGVITDNQGTLALSAAKVDKAKGNALVKLTFADGSTLNVAFNVIPEAKNSSLTPASASQKPSTALTPAKPHDNAKVNAHIKEVKVLKDDKALDIDKVNKALTLTDKNDNSTDIKPSKVEFVPNKVMLNDHSLVAGGVITDTKGTLDLSAAKVDKAKGNALVKLTFEDGSTLNVAFNVIPEAKSSSLTPATASQKPSTALTPAHENLNGQVIVNSPKIKVSTSEKTLDINKVSKNLKLTDKTGKESSIKPSKIEFIPNKVILKDGTLTKGGMIIDTKGTLDFKAEDVKNAKGNAAIKLTFEDGSTKLVALTIIPEAPATALTPAKPSQKPQTPLQKPTETKPHTSTSSSSSSSDNSQPTVSDSHSTPSTSNNQPLIKVTVIHNSYVYKKDGSIDITRDEIKNGKRVSIFDKVIKIDGKLFYQMEDGAYIKAHNVKPTLRKTIHRSFVYNKRGKRVGKSTIKKGTKINTYGGIITIKSHKFYIMTNGNYIKANNVKKIN